jgi:hypothetical protein
MKLLKYLILILSLSITAQAALRRHRGLKSPKSSKGVVDPESEPDEPEPAADQGSPKVSRAQNCCGQTKMGSELTKCYS